MSTIIEENLIFRDADIISEFVENVLPLEVQRAPRIEAFDIEDEFVGDGEADQLTSIDGMYKSKEIFFGFNQIKTMMECTGCGILIVAKNLTYLTKHPLYCFANQSPNVSNDDYIPLGYEKATFPLKGKIFSCLRCKQCFPMGSELWSHRNLCRSLTKEETTIFADLGFKQRFCATNFNSDNFVAECRVCESLFVNKSKIMLQFHRKKCENPLPIDEPIDLTKEIVPRKRHFELPRIESVDISKRTSKILCYNQTLLNRNNNAKNEASITNTDNLPITCHICDTTTNKFYGNLFETKSEHSKIRISSFVEKRLDETIHQIDSWTNCYICATCLNQINEYDLLFTQAQKIEKELRDKFFRTKAVVKERKEKKIQSTSKYFNQIDPYEFCIGDGDSSDESQSNNRSITSPIDENMGCKRDFCQKVIVSKHRHKLPKKLSRDESNNSEFQCEICKQMLASKSSLLQHKSNIHDSNVDPNDKVVYVKVPLIVKKSSDRSGSGHGHNNQCNKF